MPAIRNKRQRETDTPYLYYAKGAEAKKRRLESAAEQRMLIRGGFQPQTRTPYVPRTPGGNVVADNHYFDGELALANLATNTNSWTGTEVDATGPAAIVMNCLFAPIQGDDISNRTGRKCFVKKIRISGVFFIIAQTAQSTLDIPCRVRAILYQDKQTNYAQSQGEDVINSGTAINALTMFQNTANFGRFKIFKDKTFVLRQNDAVAATAAGNTIVQGGCAVPFKISCSPNCWVNYNSTNGGTVADIVDNSFHLIINTDNASVAPAIQYKVRTTFLP